MGKSAAIDYRVDSGVTLKPGKDGGAADGSVVDRRGQLL